MRELFTNLYAFVDIPALMLACGNLGFIIVLIRWHVDDTAFDFRASLLDATTGVISFTRLGQLVALVATTEWGMYEAVKGRLTEWFVLAYLGAWGGLAALNKIQDAKVAAVAPAQPSPKPREEDPKP